MFDKIPQRDIVSWNSVILGYALNGYMMSRLQRKPDEATVVSSLKANSVHEAVVKESHAYVLRKGVWVSDNSVPRTEVRSPWRALTGADNPYL